MTSDYGHYAQGSINPDDQATARYSFDGLREISHSKMRFFFTSYAEFRDPLN